MTPVQRECSRRRRGGRMTNTPKRSAREATMHAHQNTIPLGTRPHNALPMVLLGKENAHAPRPRLRRTALVAPR
jgi:hypothetical protein